MFSFHYDDTPTLTIDDLTTEDILSLLENHNKDSYEDGWTRIPSSDDLIHRNDVEAILSDLQDFCQQAISALRKGSLPVNSDLLADAVLPALKRRGLVWELTKDQIELTPPGRGVNPLDFRLV
jgi:hypothetical protein